MRRQLTWTIEQRTALHLLRTETDYNHVTAARIFNHLFATELEAAGYAEGLDHERVRDEYNSKFKSGRSKAWLAICSNGQSAVELRNRELLFQRITAAAVAVGSQSAASELLATKALPMVANDISEHPAKRQKIITSVDSAKPETTTQHKGHSVANKTFDARSDGYTPINDLTLANKVNNRHFLAPVSTYVAVGDRSTHAASQQTMNPDMSNQAKETDGSRPSASNEETPISEVAPFEDIEGQNQHSNSNAPNLRHSITGQTVHEILEDLEKNIDNAYGGIEAPDDGSPLPANLGDREIQAWENYRDAVYNETGTHLRRDPLGPPLDMIHHSASTTIWKGNTPHSPRTAFIDQKHPVYKLGGKVFRAGIDREIVDIMVCERDQCARCKFGRNDDKAVIVTESKIEGLPFVHASDFYAMHGAGFHYLPSTKMYDGDYPERKWKTKVAFWDGKQREVMVCEAGVCVHCSGQDIVAKKAARYKPGSDLYEMKKAAERASKQ